MLRKENYEFVRKTLDAHGEDFVRELRIEVTDFLEQGQYETKRKRMTLADNLLDIGIGLHVGKENDNHIFLANPTRFRQWLSCYEVRFPGLIKLIPKVDHSLVDIMEDSDKAGTRMLTLKSRRAESVSCDNEMSRFIDCFDLMMDIWNNLPYEALSESKPKYWKPLWEPIEDDSYATEDISKIVYEIEKHLLPKVLQKSWKGTQRQADWRKQCKKVTSEEKLLALSTILYYDAICWRSVTSLKTGKPIEPEEKPKRRSMHAVDIPSSSKKLQDMSPSTTKRKAGKKTSPSPSRHKKEPEDEQNDVSTIGYDSPPLSDATNHCVQSESKDEVNHKNPQTQTKVESNDEVLSTPLAKQPKIETEPVSSPKPKDSGSSTTEAANPEAIVTTECNVVSSYSMKPMTKEMRAEYSSKRVRELYNHPWEYENMVSYDADDNIDVLSFSNRDCRHGVWPRDDLYQAYLKIDGDVYYFGYYKEPQLAAVVHDAVCFIINLTAEKLNFFPVSIPYTLPISSKEYVSKLITLVAAKEKCEKGHILSDSTVKEILSSLDEIDSPRDAVISGTGSYQSKSADKSPPPESQGQQLPNIPPKSENVETISDDVREDCQQHTTSAPPTSEITENPTLLHVSSLTDTKPQGNTPDYNLKTHEFPSDVILFVKDDELPARPLPCPVDDERNLLSPNSQEYGFEGVFEWRVPPAANTPYYAKVTSSFAKAVFLGSYPNAETAALVYDAATYLANIQNRPLNFPLQLPFVLPESSKDFIRRFMESSPSATEALGRLKN